MLCAKSRNVEIAHLKLRNTAWPEYLENLKSPEWNFTSVASPKPQVPLVSTQVIFRTMPLGSPLKVLYFQGLHSWIWRVKSAFSFEEDRGRDTFVSGTVLDIMCRFSFPSCNNHAGAILAVQRRGGVCKRKILTQDHRACQN